MSDDALKRKIENLPSLPGVYKMKDSGGDIIYVGKAKSLKNRVRSYFTPQSAASSAKGAMLAAKIKDIDYIVTDSEVEALLLECNLIKAHKPFYNIMLKDDKTFPFINLTTEENYPRVLFTRTRKIGVGSKFFGPYHNAAAARNVVDNINLVYPLQSCAKKTAPGKKVGAPCLYYHIGQCLGCCTGQVPIGEYGEIASCVAGILSGKHNIYIDKLKERMGQEAQKQNYELAGVFKEAIQSAESIFDERQKIDSANGSSRDLIAIAFDDTEACAQVFKVRDGKLAFTEERSMRVSGEDLAEILSFFLLQYYFSSEIPSEIVVQLLPEGSQAIQDALSSQRGAKAALVVPARGDKARLLKLAESNAAMRIDLKRSRKENAQNKIDKSLAQISSALNVGCALGRIEAFDISNTGSSEIVASMVVYENGKKAPKQYRKFRIRHVKAQDDYGALAEVLFRRLSRAKDEEESGAANPKFLPLPDLMLMDGGTSHINVAKNVVGMFGYRIAIAGMVKDSRHKIRGLVNADGEEMPISQLKDASKLLSQISEEVHRSAKAYHDTLRSSSMSKSVLTDIEGIGQKRSVELLGYFGSIEAIMAASPEELAKAPGMSQKAAQAVFSYFSQSSLRS
ncbi:MAG: excinuclease ABC subunit UvrC [Eubacteriaceae bacterium]|nr:excinuclease ABC subunit UvrC [Eubacteriaceae bacterium]